MKFTSPRVIEKVYDQLPKVKCILRKLKGAYEDDWGTGTYAQYQIEVWFDPHPSVMLLEERQGMLFTGAGRIFTKPYYVIGTVTVAPEGGDRVVIKGQDYEIYNVIDYMWGERVFLKECLLR